MILMGAVVNAIAAAAGGAIGLLLRGRLPQRISQSMLRVMGICTLILGIQGALQTQDFLMLLLCTAIGTLLGELLRIEDGLQHLGNMIQGRLATNGTQVAEGFITATLLYCVGAMTIVGSLESGLTGNHATLYMKAMLDGISAILLASTMGAGVLLAAIPVLLLQGGIALAGGWIAPWISDILLNGITAVGGVLIACIGINMAGLTQQKLKTGNMLPALVLPALYLWIKGGWA